MHVEGAVSYSITFDPMTKTEPVHDFVRFLKVSEDQSIDDVLIAIETALLCCEFATG